MKTAEPVQKETTVINKETATKEIERWLAAKQIGTIKREKYQGNINILIGAVMEGNLIVSEDGSFTQKLKFPIKADIETNTLKYKTRLTTDEGFAALEGSDGSGRQNVLAYLSALTGEVKAFFGKLDTEDYSLCNSIVVFFL